MNTRTAPTVVSFFSAVVVTLAMLASVDTLATSQPTEAQLAHAAAAAAKA
jgi:hypothetical protein